MGSEKPTVAHLHSTYLNLTENWIYHQVRFLRGVRSCFLVKRTANLDQFPGNPVYALMDQPLLRRQWSRLMRHLLAYYPFYRRVCRQEKVRLIHAHAGLFGCQALPLAQSLRVPLLTSFYGYEMYVHREGIKGLRRTYERLFEQGAGMIAEGPAAREQLVRIGCPPEKVHIHRLGVDPAEIPFEERHPCENGPFKILMAARFDEKKGLPYGVEAVCRIAQEEPQIELTIVGDVDPNSVPEGLRVKQRLHELVAQYAMSERVCFTGFLSGAALRTLAREHHLFLHPSVREENGDSEGGHPVVLTEMAAAGMPIIATWHCDIPEIVVHGETGWLCAERNVEELIAALEDAFANRSELPAYSRRARRLVEAKYDGRRETLDRVYEKYLH